MTVDDSRDILVLLLHGAFNFALLRNLHATEPCPNGKIQGTTLSSATSRVPSTADRSNRPEYSLTLDSGAVVSANYYFVTAVEVAGESCCRGGSPERA